MPMNDVPSSPDEGPIITDTQKKAFAVRLTFESGQEWLAAGNGETATTVILDRSGKRKGKGRIPILARREGDDDTIVVGHIEPDQAAGDVPFEKYMVVYFTAEIYVDEQGNFVDSPKEPDTARSVSRPAQTPLRPKPDDAEKKIQTQKRVKHAVIALAATISLAVAYIAFDQYTGGPERREREQRKEKERRRLTTIMLDTYKALARTFPDLNRKPLLQSLPSRLESVSKNPRLAHDELKTLAQNLLQRMRLIDQQRHALSGLDHADLHNTAPMMNMLTKDSEEIRAALRRVRTELLYLENRFGKR